MSTFDETFDWIVVGSGAGSMSSGMLMRQTGKSMVFGFVAARHAAALGNRAV